MTEHTDDFVALVRTYVALIDAAGKTCAYDLLASCASLLPRIYAAGLNLPSLELGEDGPDSDAPSPMAQLIQLFGRYDNYFQVFDPVSDEKSVVGSLADDLADIYLDLRRPLVLYDTGYQSSALWEWRFNVRGHCGDHIVNALRAIHRLIHDHMPPDYRAEEQEGS